MQDVLSIVPIGSGFIEVLADDLWEFFVSIKDCKYFHPHEFDRETAIEICNRDGDDLYYALINEKVLAYGFIRGWDDNWKSKCLGIIVSPKERNKNYGELLCRFLHVAAARKGIRTVRLHVNEKNKPALKLYEKLGYEFTGKRKNNELIGFKKL